MNQKSITNIRPIDYHIGDNMQTRMHLKFGKIVHAIAYIDVFMMSSDPEESELTKLFDYAHSLSTRGVVSFIKQSVKRNNVYGMKLILEEMNLPEFEDYIRHKLEYFQLCITDSE